MSLNLDKSGWTPSTFGAVVRNVNITVRDPESVGIDRVIAMEHLDPGELKVQRWGGLDAGTTFTRLVKPGQTLFGKRRAYQRKVAYAEFDAICSGDILVFEADPARLLPEFLPFLVQSEGFFDHALGTSAGSLSPRTNWRDLSNYEFLLPPLDEQKRIAGLLWAFERHRVALTRLLRAAVVVRATHLQERMDSIGAGVGLAALDDLIEDGRPITYGILMPGTGVPNGVPVVKVRDYPNGVIAEDLLLTSHELAYEYRRSTLREGDLIVSIRGTVGRLAEVPGSLTGANITQDTARLSISEQHDKDYVRLALESEFVQAQMRRMTTGLAVKGLNIAALRQIQIPVPASEHEEAALVRESRVISDAITQLNGSIIALRDVRAALLADIFGAN